MTIVRKLIASSFFLIGATHASFAQANSCVPNIASPPGSLISLSLCAGMINQAETMLGNSEVFENFLNSDMGNFFWTIDQECNYFPIVNNVTEAYETGKARIGLAAIERNFTGVAQEMGRCNALLENHIYQ